MLKIHGPLWNSIYTPEQNLRSCNTYTVILRDSDLIRTLCAFALSFPPEMHETQDVVILTGRHGRHQMILHTGGSSTHTEDGDVTRISSKLLDVLLNPAQSHHLVLQTVVTGNFCIRETQKAYKQIFVVVQQPTSPLPQQFY